jgi:hypothetical protein
MIRRAWVLTIGGLLAVAGCAVEPNAVEPNAENLRDSFASQIIAVDGVADVALEGDELTFSGPNGQGGTASWRVHIASAELRPGPSEQTPFEGHIASSWYRDGEEVEFLGTMSALPKVFLDTGVGQECYALWDSATNAWGW